MAIDGARSKRPISANISRVFFRAIILPLADSLVWIFLSRSGVVDGRRHTLALSSLRVYGHDVLWQF